MNFELLKYLSARDMHILNVPSDAESTALANTHSF